MSGLLVYANDFTDGLALHAIRLIFANLEQSVVHGDIEARERMHNAGTIAGMAFGSAFLGIVHAMSHTLGATFHIAHGRTNAVLLPHVIRYNGTPPSKLFLAALPQQALNAYEDQCAPANPRMPMLDDMQELMRAAFHGTGHDQSQQ
ncbi:iron-containing alcohol dehydrogenase [Actinoplanes xinjiangensis]|uniref:iron-containing alcohol dehydrogenase n=1 Tax=Actinoplanes xinjiangensis TaxID=512350 RepID=UPI00342583F9